MFGRGLCSISELKKLPQPVIGNQNDYSPLLFCSNILLLSSYIYIYELSKIRRVYIYINRHAHISYFVVRVHSLSEILLCCLCFVVAPSSCMAAARGDSRLAGLGRCWYFTACLLSFFDNIFPSWSCYFLLLLFLLLHSCIYSRRTVDF